MFGGVNVFYVNVLLFLFPFISFMFIIHFLILLYYLILSEFIFQTSFCFYSDSIFVIPFNYSPFDDTDPSVNRFK